MHWNSMNEFFAMGGYGFFVWGAFGVTALLLGLELGLLRRKRKETLKRLRRLQQVENR